MSRHMNSGGNLGKRLSGAKGMLYRNLRQRVLRVLAGDGTADDFKSLFLELRFKTKGRRSFRDIADFIAHRDIRDRGTTADLVRDVFVSARVFTMLAAGKVPSPEEARLAAHANLRLVPDDAIARDCAMKRKAAVAAVDRAADMLAHGLYPGDRDRFVFNFYGNRLKWHPAFLDSQVIDEWIAVLEDNRLLLRGEREQMRSVSQHIILFVLALLHGSEIKLNEQDQAVLQAGFFNKEKRLEVKAYLTFDDLGKPVHMPLCVFLTNLQPEGLCDENLLQTDAHGWDMPIEFASGKLRMQRPKTGLPLAQMS